MTAKSTGNPIPEPHNNDEAGDSSKFEAAKPAIPSEFAVQFEEISTRAERIEYELERTHDQLAALHSLTADTSSLLNSADPRQHLMQTWGRALDAATLIVIDSDQVLEVAIESSTWPKPEIAVDEIRQAFMAQIAALATNPEPLIIELSKEQRRVIGGGFALIAAPFRGTDRPSIWLTIRHWAQACFDSADKAVARSAVTYGDLIQESNRMMQQLEGSVMETVRALANAIDAKDRYTHGHSQRVSWLAKNFGLWLKLNETDRRVLEWSGLLHDVGKIGIPESILCKTGRLTEEEFSIIKQHPQMSYDVIAPVASLRSALPAVLHHHENFDGSGYPGGLYGHQTPLFARMLRLVDVFDALTSQRSYRAGFQFSQALDVIVADRNKASDPELTDEFIAAMHSWNSDPEHEFNTIFEHISDVVQQKSNPPVLVSITQEPRI